MFVKKWNEEKEWIINRWKDFLWTIVAWMPILILGCVFFALGVVSEPTGTLFDMVIRLNLVVGKILLAVYLGEVFWNLFFPTLEATVFRPLKNVEAKFFHIMYGRLIMHFIMQFAIMNV
jgi:hypothetical protein